MNRDELKKYTGTEELTVIEAMGKIDRNAKGIIYIIDDEGHLKGSLTDGDIRRWILKTGDLSGQVAQMFYKNTKYLFEADAARSVEYLDKESIRSVPIVNSSFVLTDICFRDGAEKEKINHTALALTPVIVMAGGKGTRLYPYTKILPKPLIPIGEVPILERIFERFYQFGAKEFYVTVNYKKEIIKSFFYELNPPYDIKYIEEDVPMGTAGSIRLIRDRFDKPVIVTNCDILVDANYEKVMEYHNSSQNDITIISSLKNMIIPYGVLHTKECGIVSSIEEKPHLSYFINTGMYIINPEFLDWIPENRVFHMTDLVEKMMRNKRQVGMYPVSENAFLDMGEFEEMKRMEERISGGI